MDCPDANHYISEAFKYKKEQKKEQIILLYNAVMWNRLEPKDVPSLDSLIQDHDEPVRVQTPEEQDEIVRSIGRRAANGKS